MDTLINNLHNQKQESINYTNLVLDLHNSKKVKRSKYINYLVHGLNEGKIDIDKIFYKSVISCITLDQCFLVGLLLRLGANIERFYNNKNIGVYIVDRYSNYNEEIFVFMFTMMLLVGLSYNDFIDKNSSINLGEYFQTKSIGMFYPKNIKLENQKFLNLFMDKILTQTDYLYDPNDVMENLNINIITGKFVKTKKKYHEDILISRIVESSNFNMFMNAFDSSYDVTYFSIQRICVLLRKYYEDDDIIMMDQMLEMLHYLNKNKVYIDNYQYDYISDIDTSLKYEDTSSINMFVKELLEQHEKQYQSPEYILSKLDFKPSYIKHLDDTDLTNLMYKVVYFSIQDSSEQKIIDII